MHITRIELENIKSHVDSSYDFPRGTTAITGENGAGKTTLIEAVAWALFDLLDYKKEDFVRRGAKKGVVRVTFESGLDERLYTVYRDTGTGYNVYDPALKTRVADKKEEVCRFLWQHLGVEPGTDLDSLFRRAIGVPQGTFTAIFLETPATRERAFNKLLKVEEYRRGADELLKTSRYLDQQIAAVRERIARAEGEIARIDAVEEEHKAFAGRIEELSLSREEAARLAAAKKEQVAEWEKAEAALLAARASFDRSQHEHSRLSLVLRQHETELGVARQAAERVAAVRSDFERHTAAVLRLKELERERVEREKLRSEAAKVEAALASVQTEQRVSQDALERALKAHAEISSLKVAAQEQDRLEVSIGKLRDEVARARAIRDQIETLEGRVFRLRESYKSNKTEIAQALEKTKGAGPLEELQQRDAAIIRELAALHAALERDERFQKEIKNGLCPVLSEKCLNLKEGQTLDGFVTSKFAEVRTRIAVLETEHGQVAFALKSSREAEKFLVQLATLQAREREIAEEGKRLNDEKTALQSHIEDLPRFESEMADAERRLKELENPKARIQLLQAEANREGDLRQKLSHIESNLERLESDRQILVEQLETYKDFDAQWAEQTAIRELTQESNRVFLANEALAATVEERERRFNDSKAETDAASSVLESARAAFEIAEKNYDRNKHTVERAALIELEKREAEQTALLEAARRRENELALELERLNAIRESVRDEFREKERLEKVAELTTFIRDTLKEAAPLVARNYVYHVSLEANQLFREITGNAEHTLKWAEDYGITLEENGYDRPFSSLSGGEQMAAAMAVRLALLKQLTDIRIAFFDEPTTNMDAERRENLAVQLSQITNFDQLFVISHDDTFEGYVDNVVTVERGEPREEKAEAQGSLIG